MKTALKTELTGDIEWLISPEKVAYPEAVAAMEARVAAIEAGKAPELIWLVEHPPLYTAGTSAVEEELADGSTFPVFKTGRGGRYTYHGPGQRVIYVLLDLKKRGRDVRQHVCNLENWMIAVLKDFGVKGERREGRIGIWVDDRGSEKKIGAIGVRVRHWITYHGLALNVAPNLQHFNGIVPCGLPDFGVTSLEALGVKASMKDVDEAFEKSFSKIINREYQL